MSIVCVSGVVSVSFQHRPFYHPVTEGAALCNNCRLGGGLLQGEAGGDGDRWSGRSAGSALRPLRHTLEVLTMSDNSFATVNGDLKSEADLPVGIEITKNTKGYNWTIKIKAQDELGLVDRLEELDRQLRVRFKD